MLNARHRFHGYGSLKAVYRNGQTVRGSLMSLKFANRGSKPNYRAAVVVSRKVHKSAVVRNRIRRRTYEIIRQSDPALTAHLDLVFSVFSEQVAELETEKLQDIVQGLLQKAAIQPPSRPKTSVSHGIVKREGKS